MQNIRALKKIVNIDNRQLLLHKRELSNYLKNKPNRLITVEIDLTLSCNHKCPNCTFKKTNKKRFFIKNDTLDSLIKDIGSTACKGVIITGGGEPCLHPDLGSFVRKLHKTGIDTTLTTNGELIHRHFKNLMHGLKRIRFSIDAANNESFSSTHGMSKDSFARVIENLKKAVSYKKKNKLPIDIGVSFMICQENASEIFEAIDFYKNIGIDFLHFKPMQLLNKRLNRYYHKDYEQAKELFLKIGRFQDKNFRVSISRENYYKTTKHTIDYSLCHGAHFDMIIGADAKIYTCCHFKYNPKYCYGDLKYESLSKVRAKIKSRKSNDCFANCKMDALNQFVEFAKGNQAEVLSCAKALPDSKLPLGSKWL